MDLQPFGDLDHSPATYLLVTFSKHPLTIPFELPHRPPAQDFEILGATARELFTVADTTTARMSWIEQQFGKAVSSRTWLMVGRILKRMG